MKRTTRFAFIGLFCLSIGLSLGVQASVTGKLLDLFVTQSGIEKFFGKAGLEKLAVQKHRAKTILKALGSFSKNGVPPSSPSELTQLITKLEVKIASDKGADGLIRKADLSRVRKLRQLFAKDAGKMSKAEAKEVANSINDNLIVLAGRYGISGDIFTACGGCLGEEAAALGMKYTITTINDAAVSKALKYFRYKSPTSVRRYIGSNIRGIGSFRTASAKMVGPVEEKALAVFIYLSKHKKLTTEVQQDFIDSILKVSKNGDATNILDPQNGHKLWKLFEKDMDPDLMKEWTKLLNEVAEEGSGSASKKEAFFAVLDKRAGDNVLLREQVDTLKAKGCYFP